MSPDWDKCVEPAFIQKKQIRIIVKNSMIIAEEEKIMAQTILLFRINRDKYAVIQNVCRTLGIRIIDVARKDYFQKLGTLAQIQGFTREAKKYDGPEFPAEMLIFSEMNSDQVDAFLAEYKKAGVEPIALKAVITGNNIFWTAERTQKELLREHLFMSNIYKSNM